MHAAKEREMLTPISNVHHLRELSESEDDALRFHNSLQELRGLRSHIHHAADYCETAFLKSKDKKTLMDNTKEYICRAVVTVVDHIGTVSHNLNCRLANSDRVSETQLRINCLKQMLLSHEHYTRNLGLTSFPSNINLSRYYPRYILPSIPTHDKSNQQSRKPNSSTARSSTVTKHASETDEDVPLFMQTSTQRISLANAKTESIASLASVLPVRDGLCIRPKMTNLSFHFQNPRKHGRRMLHWKSMYNNEIISFIRRSKEQSKLFQNLSIR